MKLLLAEDEIYALKSLEQKIADLDGEYQVIGTAANGKQAMSMSVTDYLLKPVELQELRECLEQCALRRRKTQEEKHRDIVSAMKDKDFFNTAFAATGNYTVLYAVAGNPLSSADNIIHPLISGLSSETFEEALRRYFPASSTIYCFDGVFTNEKAVILQTRRLDIQAFKLRLDSTTKDLEKELSCPLSVHIEFLNDQQEIGGAIKRCHKGAAAHALLDRSVVSYAGDAVSESYEKEVTNDLIALLRLLLQQKQYSQISSNLSHIFKQWSQRSCTVCEMEKELIYLLDSLKYSSLPGTVYEFNSLFYIENLFCCSSDYQQLETNFTSLLTELFEKNSQPRENSSDTLIESAIEYFHQNLDSNITMQMLCGKFQISQVYLCRIFKKQLDMTPIDYFIHMKIERAGELLLQYPTLPVKEISEMLGFSDSYYFSKVFKKITGETPSSFRKAD